MARHTLLVDADDTLWENNIFFEKAIDDFISQLEHLGYTREYIRHILNETERRNIRQHGYGVRSFRRSLEETYLKLAGNSARREVVKQIERVALELEGTPPHILEGVPETLALSRETPPFDSPDPRRTRRAGGQGGALRPAALIRCHRNRDREGLSHLRPHDRAVQDREIARVDGGKQPSQRH